MSAGAVGLVRNKSFGGQFFNGTLNSGVTETSDFVWVAGYNEFYFQAFAPIGTFAVSILTPDYSDFITPYAPFTTTLVANSTAGVNTEMRAGAFTGILPTQVWGFIQIQLKGNAPTGATGISVTMLCGVR